MTQRILQPGEIEQLGSTQIPFLRLPERASVFSDRAARLRWLAPGHAMHGYLELLAMVADAQQDCLNRYPEPLPAPAALALAKQHAIPTFNARGWKRDASWRDALRQILARIRPSVRAPVVDLIARLETVDSVWLEDQANRILEGNPDELDRGMAVFIAAALQTYWVALVTRLDTSGFTRLDVPNICPCCGSRPVASVVRIGGAEANHRYLACSLCAAEWHLVRIKCANCDSTKGIRYYNIEGGTKAVQAEACTECDTYLKICYMTRDPQVEATADDLASLALDVLMAETTTLSRSGVNLLLFQGDGGGAG